MTTSVQTRSTSRAVAVLAAAVGAALMLTLPTTPAMAAFPGTAGQLAYAWNDGTVHILNDQGESVVGDPTGSGQIVREPAFSPNGSMLAFTLSGNRSEIWTLDLTDGTFFQLTTQPQIPTVESPSWTPDGSSIVFVGIDNADGLAKWWSVPARGQGAPQPIATPTDVPSQPQVSPRGDVIAYWDERDDRIRLFVPANGQSVTIFATGDGGIIGGQRDQDTNQDGTPYSNLLQLHWAPDGLSLLFNCNTGNDLDQLQRICEIGTDGTGLRTVHNDQPSAAGSAYSPDGTQIYYSNFDTVNGVIVPPRIYRIPANNPDPANRVLASSGNDSASVTHTDPDVGVPIGSTPGNAGAAGPTPLPGGTTAPGGGNGGGAGTQPAAPGAVFPQDPAISTVIDAADPRDAAVQVSQLRFNGSGAAHAVLSRDDTFADSLAGSSLLRDGPLLLTGSDALGGSAAAELQRVLPAGGTVYLLGGTAALSDAVEQSVTDLGFSPQRLAGADRIATALAVADELVRRYDIGAGGVAALARAGGPAGNPTAGWADSVSVGSWAAARLVPVVLTDTASMDPRVDAWLDDNGVATTFLLGGPAALEDAVLAAAPGGERVFGADRTATATAIARQLWGAPETGERSVVLINGEIEAGWAFGLPAAGLAADAEVPVLLVGNGGVSPATTAFIGTCGTPQVRSLLIGGRAIIGQDVVDQVNDVDGNAC